MKIMEMGKKGTLFLFSQSFTNLVIILDQYIDKHGLEGIARSLVDPGIISYYGNHTTGWKRVDNMKPDNNVSGMT